MVIGLPVVNAKSFLPAKVLMVALQQSALNKLPGVYYFMRQCSHLMGSSILNHNSGLCHELVDLKK